jgi:hypothetical protein
MMKKRIIIQRLLLIKIKIMYQTNQSKYQRLMLPIQNQKNIISNSISFSIDLVLEQ